jgi:hypothetical protein
MAFDYDDNGAPVGAAVNGGFDYDESGNPVSADKPAERTFGGTVKDIGISALKSAISVPEAAVGLADIPTGGAVGNLVESAGVRFKEAKRILDEELSPAQQAANRRVDQADGFFPTIGALLANPSVIAHGAIESLGSMGAGGVVGRGVVAAAPKVAPWIAAAIGEGSITAGSMAESTRQTTGDLTAAQSAMSIASGIGTGALGAIGGRLAKRLGVDDVDTMLVKGIAADASEDAAVATVKKGIVRRILEGGLSEGVFEELPQSAQEQVWQNAALGKPLMEGVDKAAAQGMLVGAAMGGGGNLLGSLARPAPTVDDIAAAPTTDDAIAAADAALAAPIDTLAPAIDAFKSEWSDEAARVPADSAIPMVGMPEQPTAAQPVEQPVATAPIIVTPDRPAGPALIALAEQLAILPAGEQTKALMRLDADMRQRVVQTMRALDPAVPSGIVTPDAGVQPGQGEAARITNEATVAASSVQPVAGTAVTNVPAYTQRAAQEIVSKDPSQEMRPHREVAGRFEVVPVISAAGPARGVFSTQPAVTEQQRLTDEESPATAMPAAPAARLAVPAAPLTAEQTAANQAAADAERSSQPRPIFGPQSQLRSETGPDIKGEKVTRNMRKVLVLMGRITGTKVVFEFAPGSSDGAVPNRSENTVHINTAAQINPMQVMGHEVTHVLRDRHAKAWASVRDALVATMPDKRKALDAFASDYWGGNAENKAKLAAARAMPDWSAALTPEQKELFHTSETVEAFLLDEMVSDLGGQHWSDEKFWLDVFAKIEKQEGDKARGIIERMVMAIRETLGKFLAVVSAQKQGDYATISPEQIEATRDAISSAYAAFIRGERTVEPDQGEHTTEHRINTSRTHSRSQGGEGEPAVLETDDELSDARARELAALSPARVKRDQRLFFEVAPKPNEAAAWNKLSDKQQRAVSEDIKSRVIPGLLKDLGVTGTIRPQLGGWMEDTNPSFALVVTRGDPAVAARAVGYVLDQEAVYALGLKPFTGGEKTGIIHFNIDSSDRALVHKIYTQIRALDSDAISGHSTLDNEMYIGLPVERMNQLEQQVVSILDKAGVATVYFDEGFGAMIGENDYGMQSDQGSSARLRAQARDVNQWRDEARKLRGRSDAAGDRSDRTGVARKSEQRPSYGEGSGEQVVGVHYSRQQRDTLSSGFFGTGMKAQERFRIAEAKDPRIKKRLYFYANTGKGIAPESDVGHHAHSVTLNNVYDMDVDPKRLYKRLAEGDPYQSPDNLMNDFESGVIDAGFDGYMTREFGKGGAVVLLGAHSVPVQYEGERARPDVPTMPAPKFSDEQKLRRKLAENRALPAGQMTGLEWKRALMREMPELDPRWLDNNKMYRRDELIPRSEPARMSESRPATWWYSPLARQADAAQMKKAPASGWKSWLKSLAAKGVKPDEIKWSGIEEWLDAQGDAQVTREQMQAYLSEFGVKIETILRGERSPVTDTTQDSEDEDYDIELNVGDWETDDPDENWLAERANNRFDEVVDDRVEQSWEDIYDDIEHEARTRIEVNLPDIAADVQRQMGDMFPVDETLVEQAARSIAAVQVAGDTWQEYTDDSNDMTDEAVQAEAVDRAFAVLSGDMDALETEARRRARAEIDDDKLLEELTDQERTWYYDDYESPQTRAITVDGVDGTFWDSTSYGERQVYYDGRELTLPRRADDADVEGAIRQYVMEEGLVAGSSGGSDSFRATKWDDYATDKSRAVPGSYREVQLTLPVGAFGAPRTETLKRDSYTVFDADGNATLGTVSEESAKRAAERIGGRWEHRPDELRTARMSVTDFYYTTHWQEANVVGHARWDEHTDGDGKRVLVLQEVQGDWGQQRREGVEAAERGEVLIKQIDAKRQEVADARVVLADLLPDVNGWNRADWLQVEKLGSQALAEVSSDVAAAADKLMKVYGQNSDLQREYDSLRRDTPDAAPFIEKTAQWAGLVMKRMIAHAIEYGFDKVVWTSGAQQVERWRSSLRKQVDTIAWEKTAEGIHIVASQNGRQRTDTRVSETALSDAIGKQMAKQIIADPSQSGEITGDDITISDTGMAGFYDRMLPNIANDILKKFDKDVRVKDIEVHKAPAYTVVDLSENGGRGFSIADRNGKFVSSKIYNTSWSGDTRADAEARIEQMQAEAAATAITTQQGFEITDKLRESAANGMPLFSQRRASAEARKSEARKEWYRSQLSEAVGGLPAKVRTGKEAALWLQSNASKLQVKKDELTWSGVLDWLATQRSVTGAQMQDWLASNGVRVRDVMLGEETPEYKRLDAELQEQEVEVARLRKAAFGAQWKNSSSSYLAMERINRTGVVETNDPFSPEQLDAMLAYGRALNRKNELFEQRKAAIGEQVKYSEQSLPGGKPGTYRELLLVLPRRTPEENTFSVYGAFPHDGFKTREDAQGYIDRISSVPELASDLEKYPLRIEKMQTDKSRKQEFRGSHYPQPNILAHVRFDERTDAGGKRVLFIEEVQSDWAQKGRKDGFAGRTARYTITDNTGGPLRPTYFGSRADAEQYGRDAGLEDFSVVETDVQLGAVPSAPFVTDTKAWVALALKRVISHAVDNGFDRVAWTTGEQQAERYDLSKQLAAVRVRRNNEDSYTIVAELKEGGVHEFGETNDNMLDGTVGKDLAAKIRNQDTDYTRYDGLDLKVGGEGMVAFYDGIVKQVARSLGATVESSNKLLAQTGSAQPGFDITERMKEQAAVGMPLFSQPRKPAGRWVVETTVPGVKRVSRRTSDDAVKIEVWDTGRTGKTMLGSEAVGRWKLRGYKVGETFYKRLADMPKDAPEKRSEPRLRTDNPGGDWLRTQQRDAEAAGTNTHGAPKRFGAVTGYFSDKVLIPLRRLQYVKGIMGEQRSVRTDDLNWLKDHMGKTGRLPSVREESTDEYAPFIQIDHNGMPWVNEGNHRIMAALELGWKHMPVEVKYYAGGELADGPWHPDKLLARDKELRDEGTPRFSERRDQWLGKSKVRTVMYHGTARDISTFRPQQADAIFLTDDPEFAAEFSDLSHSWMLNNFWTWMTPDQIQEAKADARKMLLADALPGSSLYNREERLLNQSQQPSQYMRRAVEKFMPSESNIMPLYVRAENPFDYRNPQHVQQIEQLLGGSWMGHEFINGEMVEVAQHIGDLERGDWNAIESPQVQEYIRENHDSFYVRERGVTNLAVFSPNQVKSASGNSGAYSREDDDIRRSERRIDAAIAAVYKDDRLYEALDFGPSNNSGPFDGGCLICAKALIRAFGGGDLVRIVRSNNDMTDHYGARIDGTIYDFLGSASSPAAWLARFKREEHITHKQHFAEGYDSQSDIPDDPAAEKKIAALLTAQLPRESTPRSRMSGQPINQTWTDPDVTDWDDFVRKMQDDKIDTKRVLRAIREAGVAVKEKFDAYLLETNYHGRAAARVDAFADGELRKLMEDMAMRKLTMADLDDYLWARHAPERNAANNRTNPAITDGSGMSDAQSAAILAGQAVTLNGRTIQLSAAALRSAQAVASRVDAITNGTLDLLVSSGLETQETVDTWRKTYSHYAPLKRDMESDANYSGAFNLGNGTGTGFSVRGAASKRALGSKRAVTDVLANIAMQRERAITRSEKNRVAQAVYGLALSAPNPEFWIPVNPELNKKLSPAALQAAIAELVAIGVNPLDAKNLAYEPVQRYTDPKTGLEMQRINPQLRGRDDVLSTRINGEERYVFFSNKKRAQEMVRGLKNLDAASVSGVLQVIAPVTRWFASVNTQYNPIFGMTNGIRDFSTGMLNLSSTPLSADRAAVARHAFDALRGVYADLRDHRAGKQPTSQWAQLFEQFAMDGGKTGYRDAFATSTDRAEAIAKELEHAGKGKQWVTGGERHSAVFGWLSDYNTAVENAMRLSAYKVALDKGMSRDAAASLAKNLTVNFNKKGLAATQTGALYAFFNAAVQGTARIGETTYKDGKLTDAGKKILYGGMMLGVLQAMLGAAAGWDDDEPPQFQREKNFIIPILGTDKVINVPMPLGFHVIPNIGRITAEWMMGGFKNPGKRLVRLAGLMLDAFNPIGSGTLAQTLSPTIGDPIIALGENKDWTGKSIFKEDFNKMHPTAGWTRTKDSASPPSRWLSYGINYITGGGKYEIGMASPTPDQIDYLVGQATGGVGRELLKTAQYVGSKVTGEELPMHKTPLGVGRFIGETKGQSSETSRFYRNLERIGEHKSALEAMKDDGNGEAMRTYLSEHPDARLVQVADRAQREIGYLRRQKREVIAKGGNPERVKMLEERITATTRRYNEMFKAR